MESESGFPRELLDQQADYRLEYFKNYTMAHPLLKDAYERLRNAIREPAGSPLIFVVGPTGVGKTTLRQRIEGKIIEEVSPTLKTDPGRIPIVSVEAPGPGHGNWNWRDHYKRILEAMDEPQIDKKTNPDRWDKNYKAGIRLPNSPNVVEADLRRAVEQALRYRQPMAVLVDEAQHMAKMASGRKMQDQLDCIKSLANMTDTVYVLIGTYELLDFRNLSAQLSRRSYDIHFRRYWANCEKEVNAFQNIVLTFERYLPLKDESNLVQHWEYLYERSIGCIGVLRNWLLRALNHVLKEKCKEAITYRDLEVKAPSLSACDNMISEAVNNEKKFEEKEETRVHLRKLLDLSSNAVAKEALNSNGNTSIQQNPARIKKRRVGEPNPRRYKAGAKSHAD
jgi:hypothetical protein